MKSYVDSLQSPLVKKKQPLFYYNLDFGELWKTALLAQLCQVNWGSTVMCFTQRATVGQVLMHEQLQSLQP